jgi:iron complex transport system ATP-binding protein
MTLDARVSVTVRGTTLLHDVRLSVAAGGAVAIVGPNGAGKSTLLRAVLGLVPSEGTRTLAGTDLGALGATERAGQLAWLPQRHVVRESLTALEVVAGARYRFAEGHTDSLAAARVALAELDVADLADRVVKTLSGGEAQRVALAALWAQDAPFLFLDEPGNHLDPAVQFAVWRTLGRWQRAGRALVVVTHDLDLLRFLDRPHVLGLAAGRTVVDLPAEDPALPDALGAMYGIGVRRLEVDGAPRFVLVEPT